MAIRELDDNDDDDKQTLVVLYCQRLLLSFKLTRVDVGNVSKKGKNRTQIISQKQGLFK